MYVEPATPSSAGYFTRDATTVRLVTLENWFPLGATPTVLREISREVIVRLSRVSMLNTTSFACCKSTNKRQDRSDDHVEL